MRSVGTVVIVGRTNVGKSTLFNRLTRKRHAIVDDAFGVTRDRVYGHAYFDKERTRVFRLIDTGGFETEVGPSKAAGENAIWEQSVTAIEESDLAIILVDAKAGLHSHDRLILDQVRKLEKPFIFVANKVDGSEHEALGFDFYRVGIERVVPISAAHNKGIKELLENVESRLTDITGRQTTKIPENSVRVAIVGRPNVGKSSMLNRLVGQQRSLVSTVAGTTRDSVDTYFRYNGQDYVLVDTAGIRRKTKVSEKIEALSIIRSVKAIDAADVVVVVIDAIEGLNHQDHRLISLAISRFKPVQLVVNKWDLIPKKTNLSQKEYAEDLRKSELGRLSFIPIMFMSCKENKRVQNLFSAVEKLAELYRMRVNTASVNEALSKITLNHTPQLIKKYSKRVKFFYATQLNAKPPTIMIKCNVPKEIQASYLRYMENSFRRLLGFDCIPIDMQLRGKNQKESKEL